MMVLMENIRLKEYCVDVYTYIVDHSLNCAFVLCVSGAIEGKQSLDVSVSHVL